MPAIVTSWTQTHPSYMEPELIIQYNQASGAFSLLSGGNPRQRIGSEDKQIYMKRLRVNTRVSTATAAANQVPSATIIPSLIQVPTYINKTRAEYDHHDTAMAGEWGFSIVEGQRLAMRQGHFQLLRNMLLFGNRPANGEGLIYTPGATSVALPADSNNQASVRTYDNGQMGQFFLTQLLNTKVRTMNLGTPQRFSICGPQRTLGQFEYPNIVQLVSFQRPGAGSATTAGMIKDVAGLNGDTIEWTYDDTLQNYNGTSGPTAGIDTILIVMPELKKPRGGEIDTNEFAKLTPDQRACVLMYTDMPAPMEIPTPLAGGAVDVVSEQRASPGWAIRPEAVTVITMTY